MSLASRRVIGERLAALYWARKGMRRNPTLMTVCGLNPAKRRGRWRETGRDLGGTALKSVVGAAASLAAGPLIKRLGGFMGNPMMLLTAADRKRLPPIRSQEKLGMNAIAHVKFFTPDGQWTWYATEFDGRDEFFGLVQGFESELGYFSLAELTQARGRMGLPVERDRFFRPTPLSQLPKMNPRRRNPGTVGSALLAGATSAVVGRMLRNSGRRNPAVSMPPDLRGAVEAAARSGIYSAVPYAQLLLSGDTMYDDPMGTLLYLKSNLSYWRGPEAAAAKAVIAKYAKKPVRTWMSNPLNRRESGNLLRRARGFMLAGTGQRTYPQGLVRGRALAYATAVEQFGVKEGKRAARRLLDRSPKYGAPMMNPCGSRFRKNSHLEGDPCQMCGGPLGFMGGLGNLEHYRCRNCGAEFSVRKPQETSFRSTVKRAHRQARAMRTNPGPSRKTTVPISKFAGWVKSQRNPALMADFRKKIAAYKKWTHGSLPTKVSVEKINSPGLNGMIIATGLGKSPESTYIMPSGSKRGGAWKHKWETMPDMADAGNGLLVTKLRGKSRVTNFFHK